MPSSSIVKHVTSCARAQARTWLPTISVCLMPLAGMLTLMVRGASGVRPTADRCKGGSLRLCAKSAKLISPCSGEVPLGKRAAGARLQVFLEARRGPFVAELQRHDDGPWAMLERVSTRSGVVPLESFVDVRGATYIMSRWITLAAKDVHESSADALHCESRWHFSHQRERLRILRQRPKSVQNQADVAMGSRVRVRGN